MEQLQGRILIIGPGRSGKSHLTDAWRRNGVNVIDAEKVDGLIGWFNDESGERVTKLDYYRPQSWFTKNHFLMDRAAMSSYLEQHPNIIVFAHCWNIFDCLDLFDKAYFMYLDLEELDRRMRVKRADHPEPETKQQREFMRERHISRLAEAKARGLPILDVLGDAPDIYKRLAELVEHKNQ